MKGLPVTLRAIARHGPLRRVLVAYTLYDLVELSIWVAIVLYAYAEGGVGLTSLVAVVQLIPAAVLSPGLVGLLDRLPRGTALLVGHSCVTAATALTAVLLLVSAPVPIVVFGSALATLALAVVRPIHYAVLPRLARSPGELVSANALSSMAEGLAFFAGPVLAGIGVQFAGPAVVFVGASVAGVCAVVLCLRLDAGRTSVAEVGEAEGWRAALGGVVTLWRDWAALALLLVMTTRFVIGGAVDVLGVSFAGAVLDIGESGAGLVIGAIGIGGMVGGAVAASVSRGGRLAPVTSGSGVLMGVAFAAVSFATLLAPAVVTLALSGLAGAVLLVAGRTLLQRTADDRVLARVFAVQEGVALLGVAVGAALAPILVQTWGAAKAFIPLGMGVAVIVIASYLLLRRLDARAVLRPVEIALLRRVGFLAALPPYELERLARNAAWLDVAPGDDVVRQGESGHQFFVIDHGAFTVVRDGERRPGLLESGEAFGELALLRSAPRNATVTAVTAARLLVVDAEDFLAAVTGGVDGARLADAVSAAHDERDLRHGSPPAN